MMIPTSTRAYWVKARSRDFVLTCTIAGSEYLLHKAHDISVIELAQLVRKFDNLDNKHIVCNFKMLKAS